MAVRRGEIGVKMRWRSREKQKNQEPWEFYFGKGTLK
jgi:hypothetical protein